jgi:hypothetical protein
MVMKPEGVRRTHGLNEWLGIENCRILSDSTPESYRPLSRPFFCWGMCGSMIYKKGELWKRSFLGI